MSNIRRLFVEKKDAFAVEAHGLLADLRNNLGMSNLTGMRIVNRYDVMGLSDEEFAMAKQLVLSEPPVDNGRGAAAGCRRGCLRRRAAARSIRPA